MAKVCQKESRLYESVFSRKGHLQIQRQHPGHHLINHQNDLKLAPPCQNVQTPNLPHLPQLARLDEIHFRQQLRVNESLILMHLPNLGLEHRLRVVEKVFHGSEPRQTPQRRLALKGAILHHVINQVKNQLNDC